MLFPPVQYQCVEEGLHRSGFPSETNFPFLRSLKLKTVIILDDECPLALINFLEEVCRYLFPPLLLCPPWVHKHTHIHAHSHTFPFNTHMHTHTYTHTHT